MVVVRGSVRKLWRLYFEEVGSDLRARIGSFYELDFLLLCLVTTRKKG